VHHRTPRHAPGAQSSKIPHRIPGKRKMGVAAPFGLKHERGSGDQLFDRGTLMRILASGG
jgi:hypothetical protein